MHSQHIANTQDMLYVKWVFLLRGWWSDDYRTHSFKGILTNLGGGGGSRTRYFSLWPPHFCTKEGSNKWKEAAHQRFLTAPPTPTHPSFCTYGDVVSWNTLVKLFLVLRLLVKDTRSDSAAESREKHSCIEFPLSVALISSQWLEKLRNPWSRPRPFFSPIRSSQKSS